MPTELLDIHTQYALKKAAPVVTNVTRDGAEKVVEALINWSDSHERQQDITGKSFWQTSLGELIAEQGLNIEPYHLGKTLRSFSLVLWRKKEGYHVAWSEEQLSILRTFFQAQS